MKNKKGLSYMEMVIALSLFAILFLAVLPLITQASRNLSAAREGHEAHYAAQNLMHAVRAEMNVFAENERSFSEKLSELCEKIAQTHEIETFRVWIFFESAQKTDLSFGSDCAPDFRPEIPEIWDFSLSGDAAIIVAAVWNEHGGLVGRAVGVGKGS